MGADFSGMWTAFLVLVGLGLLMGLTTVLGH
jgi:hypothetical protein